MFGKGSRHSEKTKQKISQALKGHPSLVGKRHSLESRARMSASHKGKQVGKQNSFFGKKHSPETCQKISNAMMGKKRGPFSEEHSRKKSDAQRGDKNNAKRPEVRAKISASLKGRHLSEETRRKKSIAMKGRPFTEDHRRHLAEANRSPEVRAKKSGPNAPNWRGGVSFKPYCLKFNRAFKERIREKFGRKCFLCPQVARGKKQSVHHIDYAKNSICDGHEWAFLPLCSSCHGKTGSKRWYWFNLLIYYWAMNPEINLQYGDIFVINSI